MSQALSFEFFSRFIVVLDFGFNISSHINCVTMKLTNAIGFL